MAHINETRLVCVKLPANLCPFTSEEQPRYLGIVFDERHSERLGGSPAAALQEPQAITHAGKQGGLPFLPRYELVSLACSQRAVDTLDGTLRVSGRRVEPEAYLHRWRKALEEAITVDQLRANRLQLVAEIVLDPAAPCLVRRPNWINAPFPNLAALLQSRGGLVGLAQQRDAELHPPGASCRWTCRTQTLRVTRGGWTTAWTQPKERAACASAPWAPQMPRHMPLLRPTCLVVPPSHQAPFKPPRPLNTLKKRSPCHEYLDRVPSRLFQAERSRFGGQ